MSLKIVSVNIEGQKHLDKITKFIRKENADVVVLMECFEDTITTLAGSEYPYRLYVPTYQVDQDEEGLKASNSRVWGEMIMSKYPLQNMRVEYLKMGEYGKDNLPIHGTDNHVPTLLMASLVINEKEYRIGTIHFTWTPKGSVSDRQRAHVNELLKIVSESEIVLCGDFNIPRGNETYRAMTKHFKDNIPPEIETTLDPDLHYANNGEPGRLKLVVDYVWSTPKYIVSDVSVVSGVSDHCAVVASVNVNDAV